MNLADQYHQLRTPLLARPVLSSIYERSGSPLFKVGSACVNGHRESMEDAHIAHLADGWGLFGVFDGHVNDLCSAYLEEEFGRWASRDLKLTDMPLSDDAIKSACLRIDKKFLDAKRGGGSTGTFFIAHQSKGAPGITLAVGNVGDSRVLLCPSEGGACKAMTTDHKPNDTDERRRIMACGGHVENNRVNGSLALSRAFGDADYKRNGDDQLQQQVIALPDVTRIDGIPTDGTSYALLACDGVFEGQFSNEQVIQFVNEQLKAGEKDLAVISHNVCVESINRGSKDNISCMIVQFGDGSNFVGSSVPIREFVPGPISMPGDIRFRRGFFSMALKAGMSSYATLERRYEQLQAKLAGFPDMGHVHPPDAFEMAHVFKRRADPGWGPAERRRFFEQVVSELVDLEGRPPVSVVASPLTFVAGEEPGVVPSPVLAGDVAAAFDGNEAPASMAVALDTK